MSRSGLPTTNYCGAHVAYTAGCEQCMAASRVSCRARRAADPDGFRTRQRAKERAFTEQNGISRLGVYLATKATPEQKAAYRQASVNYRARADEHATRNGEPWTDADLAVLAREDLTVLQKAIMVNRSYDRTMTRLRGPADARVVEVRMPPWTDEEDAAIGADLPTEVIADQIGRTVAAIRTRRSTLGMTTNVHGAGGHASARHWTPEEDAALASGSPPHELAQKLGRTPGSIRGRRLRLGLTDHSPTGGLPGARAWTAEEDAVLARPGVPMTELLVELPGRTMGSATARRGRLIRAGAYVPSRPASGA